jgi:hypothetical protein
VQILKLNRNKFPIDLSEYLNSGIKQKDEEKSQRIRQLLKSWYQDSFLKNNRWNRTLIYSLVKNYTDTEIIKLGNCFQLLFEINRAYNQTFLRYVRDYKDQREAEKKGLRYLRLKVDQKTFKEIIQYFGDLKREGKIKNANHEIAKVLKEILEPDVTFETSTILDRLKNKKEYY